MNPSGTFPNTTAFPAPPSEDVAIVGMSCVFPGARNLQTYWENILNKVDAVGDPPPEWESEFYFDAQSGANNRVYCARGGYLGKLAEFDPLEYGVMPNSVDGGEPDHFLALRAAQGALADAGYLKKDFPRQRSEVIIGRGTYVNRGNTTAVQHGIVVDQVIRILEQLHPEHSPEELAAIREKLHASLPPFHAETAAGLVPNIISGRISNRLDLMGPNYIVDAACASSLVAVDLGIRDLLSGRCDLVIAGGVHASTPPPIVMIFCQLKAISRRGELRPFDAKADGTLLGEGVGMVVLKRRKDAERDGDRIYAIVKGVGTASDGRALGLLAPRLEGEVLALERAYQAASVPPETVELIEAHGTATPVGDVVEIEALSHVFGQRRGSFPQCALGSVKSMVGHLMPASGMAGLIKTVLALYHKVLPPTIHCEEPNPKLMLDQSVFYLNSEVRPWIHGSPETPRRAGVNAFGFGGINAHVVLEEYTAPSGIEDSPTFCHRWDSEAVLLSGDSREALGLEVERILQCLPLMKEASLKDLAYTLNVATPMKSCRLAIVASSLADLETKLARARKRLLDPRTKRIREIDGIYYFDQPLGERSKVAFVFPGEGSQYTNMLADLCIHFPSVRRAFDLMDRAFLDHRRGCLPSQVIFPPPVPGETTNPESTEGRLWEMDFGAEAVFTANQALNALLEELQVRADAMVGHSTGEHSALLASGVVRVSSDEEFVHHVQGVNAVYEALQHKATIPEGVLVAVGGAKREFLDTLIEQSGGQLHLAMDNCPHQAVLCGSREYMAGIIRTLQQKLAICQPLNFARPYHTPWFEVFSEDLRAYFDGVNIGASKVDIYSCLTADQFPREPQMIRSLVSMQWSGRVRFRETIEKMYSDGVRIFIEVGPRGNLIAFIDDTLRGKEYAAIPANVTHRSGITQLNHLLAQLAAHGVPFAWERLYQRRSPQRLALGEAAPPIGKPKRMVPLRQGLQALRLPPDFRLPARNGGHAVANTPAAAVSITQAAPPSAAVPPAAAPVAADVVILSGAKNPLSEHATDDKSRFFSPAESAGLQNDIIPNFSPAAPMRRAVPASPRRAVVMQEHLSTMEQFLKVQSQVMGDYLRRFGQSPSGNGSVGSDPLPHNSAASGAARQAVTAHPLLGTVTKLIPNQEAVAVRRFDLDREDVLFQDHTLGRDVAMTDSSLRGFAVVPLTVSMEILAEGGALLEPGKVLIGMRDIRAYRWIMLPDEGTTIQIAARARPEAPGEVDVSIRELLDDKGRPGPALVEGVMIFAGDYPPPPRVGAFAIQQERPSRWDPKRLYTAGMFHGPSFRTVLTMDRFGSDGTTATMQTLPRENLFRSTADPRFQTDSVLLDGAGQVVAFWIKEKAGEGIDIFPYRLKALHVYAPPPPPGVAVECRVRPQMMGEMQMTSDIDLILPGDRLYARMEGWEDRCFYLPPNFLQLRLSPIASQLSTVWDAPTAGLETAEGLCCCRLEGFPQEFLEAQSSVWLHALAHLVLGRREREIWRNLNGVFKRRREWLLGRCAAKDAVRLLAKNNFGMALCPADVEILSDAFGAPTVEGAWKPKLGIAPVVSISHSNEMAVALAAVSRDRLVGIDIESLSQRQDGFENAAFTPEEKAVAPNPPEGAVREWHLRMWCAKEAAAKAIRRGVSNGPLAVQVTETEQITGLMKLQLGESLLQELPEIREKQFVARTGREGDYVFSTVLFPDVLCPDVLCPDREEGVLHQHRGGRKE